jgi:uncharacterized coiled-coil protein SlyX
MTAEQKASAPLTDVGPSDADAEYIHALEDSVKKQAKEIERLNDMLDDALSIARNAAEQQGLGAAVRKLQETIIAQELEIDRLTNPR